MPDDDSLRIDIRHFVFHLHKTRRRPLEFSLRFFLGTVWPENVSIGRSVGHTWLDLSARNYSNVGVNAAGSNATMITLGW